MLPQHVLVLYWHVREVQQFRVAMVRQEVLVYQWYIEAYHVVAHITITYLPHVHNARFIDGHEAKYNYLDDTVTIEVSTALRCITGSSAHFRDRRQFGQRPARTLSALRCSRLRAVGEPWTSARLRPHGPMIGGTQNMITKTRKRYLLIPQRYSNQHHLVWVRT